MHSFDRYLVAIVAALALNGCASKAALNERLRAELAPYHTTCLKMGLAANTDEHARCVIALHERDVKRRSMVQEAVGEKPVAQETRAGTDDIGTAK